MEQTTERIHFERHEDDEWHDEVRITCEERWKESELSGDEWRFSYVAEFMRKGHVQKRLVSHKLDWLLPQLAMMANGGPVLDEDDAETRRNFDDYCFQPGCAEPATLEYEKVKDWCHRCGESREPYSSQRRRFCARHRTRGDCGLDDADANYKLVRVLHEGEWAVFHE